MLFFCPCLVALTAAGVHSYYMYHWFFSCLVVGMSVMVMLQQALILLFQLRPLLAAETAPTTLNVLKSGSRQTWICVCVEC